MNETTISSSGIYWRKLLAPVGPVLVLLAYRAGTINTFFFVLFFLLTCLLMIVLLKSVKVTFSSDYIRFGKDKVDYSSIVDIRVLSFNHITYWFFKTNLNSRWKRYYVTELQFIGLKELLDIVRGKKSQLKLKEFEELLKEKSSIPKKRWREIGGEEE